MQPSPPVRMRIALITAFLLSAMVVGAGIFSDPGYGEAFNDNFYEHPNAHDFFPDFNRSEEVYIVDIFPEIENGTLSSGQQYAMSCLQGLVNRESAKILVDYEGWLHGSEHLDYWDFFMDNYVDHYQLNITIISYVEFFDLFNDYANGVVVYDKGNEHTINVAAVLAGINGWLSADRETGDWLKESYGLEVMEDLNHGWEGNRAQVYEKAFEKYYASCNQRILFSSIPSEWGTDYLVSCNGFVYSLNPGPFTTPAEKALAKRIMKETPADIPVIGWFEQPTGIEENYMIQLASRSGKIFLGGFRFPNKSFFTAYDPPANLSNPVNSRFAQPQSGYPTIDPWVSPEHSHGTPEVGNKIYIAFAVTDGDNLGFMTRKMRKEMWNSPVRGSVPIAWSVNPLLVEVIPALLDYYYSTTTEQDTFICGPSGSGYFNPDFASDDQREKWLERTRAGMNELELRHNWLLNSFTTYETYYSDEVLRDYTGILEPDGIMLDYGDVPEGRKMWIQDGKTDDGKLVAAPVIRSMHIWGDTDNYMGKLIAESHATSADEPIFAFSPIMAADLDLDSIPEILEKLDHHSDTLGREYEIVSLDDFFYLMECYYVEQARSVEDELGLIRETIGGSLVEEMNDQFDSLDRIRPPPCNGSYDNNIDNGVDNGIDNGDHQQATKENVQLRHLSAYHAYEALERYEKVEDRISYIISIVLLSGLIVVLVWFLSRKDRNGGGGEKGIRKDHDGGGERIRKDHDEDGEGVRKILARMAHWLSDEGPETGSIHPLISILLFMTAFMLFFSTSLRLLYMNFWNNAFFGVAISLIALTPGILRRMENSRSSLIRSVYMWGHGHSLKVAGTVLIISAIGFLFHPASYIFIPLASIYILSSISRTVHRQGIAVKPCALFTMVWAILLSQFFLNNQFLSISLLSIWLAFFLHLANSSNDPTKSYSTLNPVLKEGLPTPMSTDPLPHAPLPLLSAFLLALLVLLQDIPFNRYLSMSSGYRMEFLSLSALMIPLFSLTIGYLAARMINQKRVTLEGATGAAGFMIVLSILLFFLPGVIGGRIALFLLLSLFGASVIVVILTLEPLNCERTLFNEPSGNIDPSLFFRSLIILIILALLIATLPQITYSVYVISLPTALAYIMYSLPVTLLIISCIVLFLVNGLPKKCKAFIRPEG